MSAPRFLGRLLAFAAIATVLHGLASRGPEGSIVLSGTSLGAHLALGVVLGSISLRHPGGYLPRVVSLFVLVYGVMVVTTAIELLFFSEMAALGAGAFLTLGAVAAAAYALLSSLLFPPTRVEAGAKGELWSRLRVRSAAGWTWRVLAGVSCYLVVYLLVGAIAFQYTGPFYTDPSYGLDLTVPSMDTILVVQVARSLIFVVALWPVAAGVRCTRAQASALGGAALFVLGGLLPLLLNTDWPAPLRFYHTVEIFFQNAPAGFAITWLTWSGRAAEGADSLEPVPAEVQASGVL